MRPQPLILLLCCTVLAGCSRAPAPAPQERWSEDYEVAAERAGKENCLLLVLFTGRDWCPGCQHLEKNILTHPDFLQASEKEIVCFRADFPRHTAQEPAVARRNMALAQRFHIRVFPTMILLSRGREIARQEGSFADFSQFSTFLTYGKAQQDAP